MINLVLCGGSGRRLWPLSSLRMPKQFIHLDQEKSLFQQTVLRNLDVCSRFAVCTNQKYADIAGGQIRSITDAEFILEPSGKNTAPAIAIACMLYPGETILMTPADHIITDSESYQKAVKEAQQAAEDGYIALFGIEPERPEPGFGYITANGAEVAAFHEKPDRASAGKYAEAGCLINSGMLCFKADVMMGELAGHMPDQMEAIASVFENRRSGRKTHRLCGRFSDLVESISIDKGVLEKSDILRCVKGIKGWNDMGSYEALYQKARKDMKGNAAVYAENSAGCMDFIDSEGCMIISENSDVVIAGLKDVMVVESDGKILVAPKGADIESLLKKLGE